MWLVCGCGVARVCPVARVCLRDCCVYQLAVTVLKDYDMLVICTVHKCVPHMYIHTYMCVVYV